MKRILFISALMLFLLPSVGTAQDEEQTPEATPEVTPDPQDSLEVDGLTLQVYFERLQQGRAGLLALRGEGITVAQASVFNRTFDFFQVPHQEGWYALINARMEQPIRPYELRVRVETEGADEALDISARVDVSSGGFIQQDVNIVVEDERLAILLDPEVEAAELAQIFELAAPITPETLWDEEGFSPPINAELTSPFGAVRVFNGTFNSIHTGWDFQATIGQPLSASAAGRVVFAGMLPIRGNYVLIDHGRGIYSGYAHMSILYVTQGQRVSAGQIVGMVGSTGRSSSAHAHIEFIVNGEWVDAADFIRMYIP